MTETEVKESRDRVRSAIINSRFEFPIRRITINLAPADLPKEGSRFDLPIGPHRLATETIEFVGEEPIGAKSDGRDCLHYFVLCKRLRPEPPDGDGRKIECGAMPCLPAQKF